MSMKIKEIAKLANVSVATVSLVLNNKPGISESTRQKILKISKSLSDSSPHPGFAQISNGSIKFLKIVKHGHVLNRDHNVFIASYIDGLEEEARTHGYNLEVTNFVSEATAEIVKSFGNVSIGGLIVLGTELNEDDIILFKQLEIPVVFIDTIFEHLSFDFVDMDNVEAAYQIVKQFLEFGHREIGFVKSDLNNFTLRERGFRSALSYFNLPLQEKYIFRVDSTFNGAYSDMLQLLNRGIKLPTALFCCNDIVAYGCIKALREKGIQVPNDISIIGFDDIPMSAFMDPPLTTMKVSKRLIGKTAMKLMIEKLANHTGILSKITIGGELVIRDSVKKLG
jgi:LacI family transcriptional regulator